MPKKFNKCCVICGDKASGYNFKAITCESCKAFFRRNGDKSKNYLQQFKCFSGDNCKIDVLTRKFCKKCRLKKCFDIGMKSELIQTEEQKEVRRNKIRERKEQKQQSVCEKSRKDSVNSSDESMSCIISSDSTSDTNSSPKVQELSQSESNTCEEISDTKDEFTTFAEFMASKNTTQISSNVYREAVELELSVIPIPRAMNSEDFNELEAKRFDELFDALKILNHPVPKSTAIADDITEAIRIMCFKSDYDIRKIVKMSKRLSAFQALCESDKICLLKYSVIEIFTLRILLDMDFDKYYWNIVTNSEVGTLVSMDLLIKGKRNYIESYADFIRKFLPEWDSDKVVIDLLSAILLFDASRPLLTHRESIKVQQQVYMYLLQRYLRMRYPSECDANIKFLRLLNSLHDLHIVNEKIASAWSEGPVNTPLLKEIANRTQTQTSFLL
ncbi:nuclear hormone receptor HR96-like [Oppia nitens]|uniref:nuclear hormone receptor HR96-like n=1 Tax=Oppia nitens TaxID=1686743 RepID=UPI0023DA6952|nr:nuclear hormone receptor HR96-like [Oppia nitens]